MKLLKKMKPILFSLVLGLCSCTDASIETVSLSGSSEPVRSLSMSVDKLTGSLNISRPMDGKTTSMGEDDSWTIFVYLCGSDLESDKGRDGGFATKDLEEMFASAKSDKVRFVIQTGGADNWHVQNITASGSSRLVIENGWIKKVGEGPKLNMGSSKTLSDFLTWGVENYPAEHMGVILWDHGGGSIDGICFDETSKDDGLLLRELETSFLNTSREMTDTFEFIGMDACLMSTIETANVLASYCDYMIASQESEAGEGWDYNAIGTFLSQNPVATGEEVGKVICDSFYATCKEEDSFTISLIDLSKINQLLTSFNAFSKELYTAASDSSVQSKMNKNITKIDYFGGRDFFEYTNMVDMGGLIRSCDQWADTSDTLQALEDAVVYNLRGSDHRNASGLSIFYPLSTPSSEDMSVFESVCVSPYYLSIVDRQVHGSNYDYDDDTWFYDDTWSWQGDFFLVDDQYDYNEDSDNDTYWGYLDEEEQGNSDLISFDVEPYVNEDSYFTFVLSEEGIDNATEVTGYVIQVMDDEDYVILGETTNVDIDWDTGEGYDLFDGTWLSLDDGQELSLYYTDYSDDADIYYAPILLNGKSCYLCIREYYDGDISVDGAYPMDSYSFSGRDLIEIKDGDSIIPLYYCLNDEDYSYKGEEYIVDDYLYIDYDDLPESDYLYSFIIYDVYGNYCFTDDILINIDEDGYLTFYE